MTHNQRNESASSSTTPALVLSRDAVRAVDQAAVSEYGMSGLVLMENASRALAAEAVRMLGEAGGKRVLIICGSGNNGGDGWALARHLHNAGAAPVVAELGTPGAETDAGVNRSICLKMGVPAASVETTAELDALLPADLIVDAIFGTGLARAVKGFSAEAIGWINASGRPVLAVDMPSGLDCDTGEPLGIAVRADVTVSFVALKPGFLAEGARAYTGETIVGDIGVPRALAKRLAETQ
jgi:hydroxyethylthiazole kinase-like uncharacterized protein yjeF